MAIRVTHSPSARVIGATAYATGRGEAAQRSEELAQRERMQQSGLMAQEEAQRRQLEQAERMERGRLDQQDKGFAQQLEMLARQQQGGLDQVELGAELARQQFEMQDAARKGMIDYQITAQQQAEWDKYQQALRMVQESDTLRPEEQLEAMRQINEKMMGVALPRPQLRMPSPYPQGQDIGDSWTSEDEDGAFLLGRKPDGTLHKIGELPRTTNKDRIDAYKIARESLIRRETKTDAKGNVTDHEIVPSHAEILREANRILGLDGDEEDGAGSEDGAQAATEQRPQMQGRPGGSRAAGVAAAGGGAGRLSSGQQAGRAEPSRDELMQPVQLDPQQVGQALGSLDPTGMKATDAVAYNYLLNRMESDQPWTMADAKVLEKLYSLYGGR